jgi:Electron transfer DM13
MLNIIKFSFILLFLYSCTKKEDAKPSTTTTTSVDLTKATLISKGTFTSLNSYSVKGDVSFYETTNEKVLVFENFTASSGPDLRVYLATDNSANSFYEVARLSGTNGNYQYVFPKSINTDSFSKTLIWCKQFSVGFGTANLNK